MKLPKIIFIIIILLSFLGCKKEEDNLQFEKNVINNVFLEIVDSIYMDRRVMLPPPSPRTNFKTNKKDTIGYHNELKEYWHYQDSIKNDKNRILIGISDYIENYRYSEQSPIIETYLNSELPQYDQSQSNEIKFDLTPFKDNKKFDFQYTSKYPHQRDWDLNDKYSLMPVGTISISRIQFNKTKTSGVLSANASCGGGKCGRGFLITIENKSGKWNIIEIVETSVS
jgi:hypothetical protein